MPVTVAERSKACTVFARSEAGTVGATSWSPVQRVLPTVPDQETKEIQPYAPKAGASSQVWEQRGRKKSN
jgi:hypothetical protein